MLLVIRDNDAAGSQSLLLFGEAHLGDGERCRDGHDAGRYQDLRIQSHVDIRDQHGASNGSKTTAHDLVKLGLGQVRDERPHQHGGFTLANEGGGSRDDGLGTRHAQSPEEEVGELDDEPLQNARVVQERDQRDEEDDGRDDTSEEPWKVGNGIVGQEGNTLRCKAEQSSGHFGNESEDVVSDLGAQHEDGNDEL